MDDEVETKPRLPFFNLKEAYEEVKVASGAKDIALAGAKLVGKGVFNTALSFGKLAVDKVKEAGDLKESFRDLDDAELLALRDHGQLEEKLAAISVLKERQV